ncbi:MAG: NADPH-dependent FMN reductase [Kofleriaceae bacterium]
MKILAISGSLRGGSKNSTALRAAAQVSRDAQLRQYVGIGDLPHFNPDLDDLDNQRAPQSVLELRRELREVEGVLICSPEYAHGVAGSLKNALDWLVGSGEFVGKPTLVMNLSPNSRHAHAALVETLRTMDAHVLERQLAVPISGSTLSEAQMLAIPVVAELLRGSVEDLSAAIAHRTHVEALDG